MGAFNNPKELLLDYDVDPTPERMNENPNIEQFEEHIDKLANQSIHVSEKGVVELQTAEETAQDYSLQAIIENYEKKQESDEGPEIDYDAIMQKKEEELQGQLNLTLIDEEPNATAL